MSKYRIILDGKAYEIEVEKMEEAVSSLTVCKEEKRPVKTIVHSEMHIQSASENVIKSPMPGTVIRINTKEGEKVKEGQTVLVLEAMKMENDIVASKEGIIKKIYVEQGSAVQGGTMLFEIEG